MGYKRLYIFVEGDADETFFNKIIKPLLVKSYQSIQIIKYASMSIEKREKWIKSIKGMFADYLFITDLNNKPCVTAKKKIILSHFKYIDENNIVVIIPEIEGLYMAGADDYIFSKLFKDVNHNTENVNKECFDKISSQLNESPLTLRLSLIENYDIDKARLRNRSFNYLMNKVEKLIIS